MISAIIVAGGKGLRMGADIKKQYLTLDGMPVLSRTLLPFNASPHIHHIFLVVPQEDIQFCKEKIIDPFDFETGITVLAGGEERQVSVYNGLKAAKGSDFVLIHDGVRPFVTEKQIEACIEKIKKENACILAIQAVDTLKAVDQNHVIKGTMDRTNIWMAQTPQGFSYPLILKSHEYAAENNYLGTDDASLVEFLGENVSVIPGSRNNIKITTKEDYELAKIILSLAKNDDGNS